jgi:serine/threonine protein kinase
MLYRGFGDETCDGDSLENALDEVEVRDADWRLGNYQILEEIGRGGMGVIYRARQRHSRRIVALKRILAHDAESHDTLVRFRREAEAAASLDHPNILPIYEVSEGEDGLPFFSMKFATGGSLLESQDALRNDTRRAIALMAKVARAVEYAHSRGILHRDLKPGNILLDGRGEPLVCDFGLAKWLDESSDLTRTLTIFGTPGYIAPEQAHGPAANLKPTADVYSLGAILFDLLAGRPPFLGEHALSVIHQAAEKPAPRLRSIVREIDRDLETICSRCLEREPVARYESAGDLAHDLEQWLDGRPVVARPVSAPVRIWRWARRNPKLASSVAGSILGAAAIVIFASLTLGPNARFQSVPAIVAKSIAVLPFQNLSDDKANTNFTDGVHDEILNDLAKVADLKVISRTSVMQYGSGSARNLREISRQLGVAHIVEGTVQRIGDRVRVSAQLIDARTDSHLWAEHYDRDLADVFAIESELAQQIVSKLLGKISPKEKVAIEQQPTRDLVAYGFYERAKSLIEGTPNVRSKQDLLEALGLLENAIARDPTFVRAHYQLVTANDLLYADGLDRTPARLEHADQALKTLLTMAADSGEAHLALAQHRYWGYRDYENARRELEIAKHIFPNDPLVFVLAAFIDRRQGHWEECITEFERAAELDPRNVSTLKQLSITYEMVRRMNDAETAWNRVLAIVPNDVVTQIYRTMLDLKFRADSRPCHAAIQSALRKDPSIAQSISGSYFYLALCERDRNAGNRALSSLTDDGRSDTGIQFPRSWCEGLITSLGGDNEAAHNAFSRARAEVKYRLDAQPNYPEALCALGMIDAALGKKTEAIEEGRRAVDLCPISKDALEGAILSQYLAAIYALTGEKQSALEQLEMVARIPAGVRYGELRLEPFWDSLRGDPRFEKIVASLAPNAKKP